MSDLSTHYMSHITQTVPHIAEVEHNKTSAGPAHKKILHILFFAIENEEKQLIYSLKKSSNVKHHQHHLIKIIFQPKGFRHVVMRKQ